MMKTTCPEWVCHDCGVKHGKWYRNGKYSGPSYHCATYHVGICQCCGKKSVPVTEPRDYGYFDQELDPEIKTGKPETPVDLIDYIIDDFNFEKVNAAMQAVGWRWACGDQCTLETPSVEKLRNKAKELLTKVIAERKSDYHAIGTGGFIAEADEHGLSLKFVLAQSEFLLSDFND